MSELQQAADGVQRLARQYRDVLALADAVGKIGSIEAHTNELERQRDKAKAELDAVLASLVTAKAVSELEKAKKAAERAQRVYAPEARWQNGCLSSSSRSADWQS